MDDVMNVSGELFRQPLEEKKLKFSNLIEGKRFQLEGYGDDAVTSQDQILGWNDRLHLQVEPEDEWSLAYWPEHPESFRPYTLLINLGDIMEVSICKFKLLSMLAF
jgi:hypothetical protein